jgi:hypothetical protein
MVQLADEDDTNLVYSWIYAKHSTVRLPKLEVYVVAVSEGTAAASSSWKGVVSTADAMWQLYRQIKATNATANGKALPKIHVYEHTSFSP